MQVSVHFAAYAIIICALLGNDVSSKSVLLTNRQQNSERDIIDISGDRRAEAAPEEVESKANADYNDNYLAANEAIATRRLLRSNMASSQQRLTKESEIHRSLLPAEWDIEPIGVSTQFDQNASKIELEYYVSNAGQPQVSLFPATAADEDTGKKFCNRTEAADNVSYNTVITNVTDAVDKLVVSVDVHLAGMNEANIYNPVNETYGHIVVCSVVDLMSSDGISVSFHEEIVDVRANLEVDILPVEVELNT